MPTPTRKSTPKTYAFEPDALLLLEQLVPSRKGFGSFLSGLIRQEVDLRSHRLQRAMEARAAERGEVGAGAAPVGVAQEPSIR
jgi:hypothetical protein